MSDISNKLLILLHKSFIFLSWETRNCEIKPTVQAVQMGFMRPGHSFRSL